MSQFNKQRVTDKQGLSLKRCVHWLSEYEWPLVGMVALGCFLVGTLGFYQVLVIDQAQEGYNYRDAIYESFQLFLFEATGASDDWPWYLEIARFVAPTTVIYTAVKAVFHQLGLHLGLFFLRFRRFRYVVVCGAGETGYRIARDFALTTDELVIVIEQDPNGPYLAELRQLGVTLIIDSALNTSALARAKVRYARYAFAFTGCDETNIAIGKAIERLTRPAQATASPQFTEENGSAQRLHCFLAIEHPDIYEVFEHHTFFNLSTQHIAIHIFNQAKTVAQNVMRDCAPDLYYRPHDSRQPRLHALFVGFEALTRELIIHYAANAHYFDRRLPLATLVCPKKSQDLLPKFLRRYPQLPKALDLRIVIDDPVTLSQFKWIQMQEQCKFSVAYVNLAKDVECILAARRLHKHSLDTDGESYFIACLNQQTLLADVLDDDFEPISPHKSLLRKNARLEYFETLDETINRAVVVNQVLDETARCIHDEYREQQFQLGQSLTDHESLLPWELLPPHKKLANQNAATHMDIKLRLASYQRRQGRSKRYPFPPDEQMLELLAEVEHRRWMADKYLSGYDYGPVRDEAKRLHPDLVCWEQLSEADKEKDRDNIRRINRLLALQHQHAVPISRLDQNNETGAAEAVTYSDPVLASNKGH